MGSIATNTIVTDGLPLDLEPIAIVGMGCRWPGAKNQSNDLETPSDFWDFLQAKEDAYRDFPAERLNLDAFYHPESNRPGSFSTRGGCFLKADPRQFDPSFFGISVREATSLDPAQRKLLEVVYEAFESGGATLSDLSGSKTGCFVGNFNYDHQLMQFRDTEYPDRYSVTGGGIALLSNRINYVFNLKGPSLTLDTACSSSMYALHLACLSIQAGECDAAVVGGANLILSPDCQMFSSFLGAVSDTSMCHTFDAAADGYARADGVGALYVKRLSQAIKDNDPIRAVIRGTAVNANGKTGGITHPDPDGQEAAIRRAYARAGNLDPSLTGYFECHGTGTPVGDPLEVEAVARVFANGRRRTPLLLGAVKSNLGHCEPVSGIAGIMKSVLALEHSIIPPLRALDKLNPNIDLKDGQLTIPVESTPWPNLPVRIASVNSFGYGGANAHTILEAVDSVAPGFDGVKGELIESAFKKTNGHGINHERSQFLLAFSAHDERTLKGNIQALKLDKKSWDIKDLAYTLGCRRTKFMSRSFTIATDSDLKSKLELAESTSHRTSGSRQPALGFVFTGQGAQWPRMGFALMKDFPVYLRSIRMLDKVLQSIACPPNWKFEDLLSDEPESSRVYTAEISQPIVTAIQIALVDLLQSWNISPDVSVGHSSGEIAAAYASGRISAAEAIVAAYERGQAVSKNTAKGTMLAVAMSAENAAKLLTDKKGVIIACHNSPESVTLSGEEEQILSIKETLDAEGAFARVVPTGGNAYHSHHMASLGPEYEKSMITSLTSRENRVDESVKLPQSAFYSSVSGNKLGKQPIDASYWRRNLESPVLFNQAVTSLVSEHHVDLFLEIGPHTALQGPLRQIAKSLSGTKFPEYVPVLIRNGDNVHDILSTAGSLFSKGYDVNLEQVNAIQILEPKSKQIMTRVGKTIVDLPKYQWQYQQTPLYNENRWAKEWRLRTHMRHDVLGSRMPGGNEKEPTWRNVLKQKDLSWLGDHMIGSDCVFPTTAYLSMAMEAATQMSEIKGLDPASISQFSFHNVNISTAIIVPDDDTGVEMLFNLQPVVLNNSSYYSSRYQFRITSVAKAGTKDIFTEHVHGQIQLEFGDQEIPSEPVGLSRATKPLSATQWYEAFAAIGLNYGPTFQGMSQIRSHIDFPAAESKVNLFPTQGLMLGESRYVIHPAALDSALQIALVAGYRGRASEISKAFMPVAIENLSIWPAALNGSLASALAEATFSGYRGILADVSLVNPTGGQILQANGIELVTAEHSMSESSQAISPFARMVWRPDFDSLTTETMSKICKPIPRSSEDVLLPQLDRLALLQTIQFRKQYPEFFERGSDIPQLQRLLNWMLQKEQLAEENNFPDSQQILSYSFEERAEEIDRLSISLVSVHGAELRLMCHMYESLPAIYRGEMTGIQAAVQGDLLTEFYRDMKLMHQGNERLAQTISLLAHKNPNLKILEVGAGTGSATREILAALKGNTSHRGYDSYMFTDTTTSFLAAAQESFKDYHGIKYSSFDMELTAKEQGYEADFDLVIASNVVHATSDIKNTLTNIRSVLKPGGRIALFEFTQPSLSATMILGTFSDFWKGDLDPNFARTEGPFLTESMWHDVFPQAGYESLDILLPQHPEQNNAAVIVATASGSNKISPNSSSAAISLVYRGEPSPYAMSFAAHLHASGFKVDHVTMDSTQKSSPRRLIFLVEETAALFNDINENEWLGMQHLILNSDSVLWVTRGSLIDGKSPLHAMISGIATALRTEVKSVKFLVVDLELDSSIPAREEFEMLIQLESKAVVWEEHQDREWRVKDGILHISRVQPDDNLNEIAKSKAISKATTESRTLGSLEGTEVEMAIDKPGVLSSIYFKEISNLSDLPKAGEVDIYVKAAGINNCDMAVAAGRFNNDTLSCECAGIVKSVGADVVDLAPGDRVFSLAFASFGTVIRTKAIFCQKMEENDKFEEMAGLPTPLAAAVYGILDCGRLQSGETVLIQSATGGVGIAACQLAKYCGAEIYATVGSESKKKELLAMGFGIQEDHIFGSRDEDTPRKILAHTGGKGIDVILCSARGELMHEYWNCIATMGRLVEIGRTEVLDNGSLSMSVFRRNATFTSFDWKVMSQTKPGIVARTMTQIKSLLLKGVLTPLPVTSFHISQAEEAFKKFSKSTHIGKLVFRYDHGEELLQFRPSLSDSSFDMNASYLLVGCLGGLGRSYVQWMVNQGARNLVFLSRSGVKGEECISFIAKLRSLGVHIDVVEGDVADKSDTLRAVATCKKPLKGVVLAALTLHDALFENMTLERFNATVKTRVQGTLNLHDATIAAPLDFFMMWSSWAAAIGIATQSNYMASNSFIDNFARYRLGQNLPATSMALSQVLDVGIVSYFPEYQANLLRNGIYGNNEEEFLQFNDAAISWEPSSSDDLLATGHLLVGIEPSGLLKTDKKNPLDQMAWYKDSRFLALLQATKHLDLNDGSDGVVVSNDDENETLINRIHAKVARFLFVPKDEIDVSRAISTYGIDSMIAAELRNWIYSAFGVQVSLLNLLSPAMSVEKLTEQISSA